MAGNLTAMIAAIFSSSAAIPDPYFEYTTLLLPGNGTNGAQNNTFLDGSTNNFTITRNGNTTQGTFSPFSQTGWGNYFDGTGDYLSVAANAAFDLGSTNFTVEAWAYFTSFTSINGNVVISKGAVNSVGADFFSLQANSSGQIQFYFGNSSALLAGSTLSANTWYHIAVTRSGNTFTLWVNGNSSATTTSSATLSSGGPCIVGSQSYNPGASDRSIYGYISNVRIVKNVAVYTGSFTPPTSPLAATQSAGTNIAAITGTSTSLLTCQSNRFKDNSTNNFTITRNGNTSVVAFSPFNPTASWSAATYGGSGYFDGSGDYLSVADNANLRFGTNAFTIQAWVYRNASGAAHSIIAKGGASTGYVLQVTSTNVLRFTHGTTNVDTTTTIPAFAWTHVAAVRTNTSTNGFQLYINGVSSATATVATDFNQTDTLYIGSDRSAANVMNGYISGLKYTNGTAESISVPTGPPTATTNVALLTNFTNAGIYDATSKNDLETVGNAQISTAQSKWGGSSMYFDGSGDYLVVGNMSTNPILALLAGDFTIEWWYYPLNTSTHGILTNLNDSDGTGSLWILTNGTFSGGSKVQFGYNTGSSGNILFGTGTFTINNWYHVAVCRSGINLRCFINGTQEGSTSTALGSGSITSYNRNLVTGATLSNVSYTAYNLNGYIQDFRITKGYARYTANFTPPTAAFPTL